MALKFTSKILILPGLGNSDETHWQSLWEKEFGFTRVHQRDWDTPVCNEWIEALDREIARNNPDDVILVGHSLACTTIAYWWMKYKRKIKGALLVAPSDTEADTYPPGTLGFVPVPRTRLEFPTLTVASANDYYVTTERADLFSNAWGSELINIGDAGHINVAAGFGPWPEGLQLLSRLDRL